MYKYNYSSLYFLTYLRNEESATMLTPRVHKLQMLGLGSTVGTPSEGITAEIIAIKDFEELAAVADQVKLPSPSE